MSDLAYIYLLQDGNDKGTNVYKIGRTVQHGGDGRKLSRLQDYSRGTVPYNTWRVHTPLVNEIEKIIKKAFADKYKLVRGSEWFEGDVKQMKKDIDMIIDTIEGEYHQQKSYLSTESAQKQRISVDVTQLVDGLKRMGINLQGNYVQDESNTSKYECYKCNKSFHSAYNVKRHMQTCNGVVNKLQCTRCQKIFASRQAKCNHTKNVRCLLKPSSHQSPVGNSHTPSNVSTNNGRQFVYNNCCFNITINKSTIDEKDQVKI